MKKMYDVKMKSTLAYLYKEIFKSDLLFYKNLIGMETERKSVKESDNNTYCFKIIDIKKVSGRYKAVIKQNYKDYICILENGDTESNIVHKIYEINIDEALKFFNVERIS
jgi:hypothetical protein